MSVGLKATLAITLDKPLMVWEDDSDEVTGLVTRVDNQFPGNLFQIRPGEAEIAQFQNRIFGLLSSSNNFGSVAFAQMR